MISVSVCLTSVQLSHIGQVFGWWSHWIIVEEGEILIGEAWISKQLLHTIASIAANDFDPSIGMGNHYLIRERELVVHVVPLLEDSDQFGTA